MAYRIIGEESARWLRHFTSLKGKPGPLSEGLFIAEGPKVVPKILASTVRVVAAYFTESWFKKFEALLDAKEEQIEVVVAPKEQMEHIIGYPLHQGVMIAAQIPEPLSLGEIINNHEVPHTIVALDSIADAENMGTIIRNAAAHGATAILLDHQSCHPYLRRSVRVSMGTITDIPILRVPVLGTALQELKKLESRIIALHPAAGSIPLSDADLSGNVTLVFGAEGTGITKKILALCDAFVQIPMKLGVDSLNVSVASGIVLYERTFGKTSG